MRCGRLVLDFSAQFSIEAVELVVSIAEIVNLFLRFSRFFFVLGRDPNSQQEVGHIVIDRVGHLLEEDK